MKRPSVRESISFQKIDFEKLEDRNLLSATTGDLGGFLQPGQEQLILGHLETQIETSYLQLGANDLQLVNVDNGDTSSTAVFQQLMEGLPIHGTFVSVEIGNNNDQILNVEDRGVWFLPTLDSQTPDIALAAAQQVANSDFAGQADTSTNGELVWFRKGNIGELAWRIDTVVANANVNNADLEFMAVVDANTGSLLSQVQSPSVIDNLVDQTEIGIYPRIVINDAIGPAGSQAYAETFDSVVDTPGCTGTLVASNVVISARHCGTGAGGAVNFGEDSNNPGFTATVESSILPAGNGTLLDGGDVAILILTADVPANVAVPMRFIDATNDLAGQLAATIGYGLNGVGSTGHGGTSDGLRWGGENIIDVYGTPANATGANIISTDFDDGTGAANTINGSDPTPLEFEATTAPGDSGGPILVNTGSEWAIAGVLSGGTSPTSQYGDVSWWTGTAVYRDDIEAVGGEFVTFGEVEVSFGNTVINSGDSFDFGVTSLGQTITRTFTVTNRDMANQLELFEPITVPDAWSVTSSFGSLLLDPGESTNFDVRFDSNPFGTYEGELSFESGDADESPFILQISAVVAPPVGEAGTIMVDGGWSTIFLRNTYIDPVIVAGPATYNDADPVTVRIRNVTTDSFQVRAQEWTYETGRHFDERISYMVMESGVHRLADGSTLIAQNSSNILTEFRTIPFELSFADTPVVVAQTVTTHGGAPVTTRLAGVNSDGFQIKVQEEEAADQTHNPETVAWMAMLPNQNNLGTLRQESVISGHIVDENVATIPFETNFAVAPVFLANMQSFVGSNPAVLRVTNITDDFVQVFVEEEQSRDDEVGHGFESIGFIALEQGDIVGRTIIGESGHVADVDRTWQRIDLRQDYLDPVVLVSVNSRNEADPGVIRVRNVTSDSFELHFEEWNYLDLNHAPELVSYVVFESGIHRLRDGTVIEARNSFANHEWTKIDFMGDNGSEAPLVFSQVASLNGPSTVTTRQQNITADGFQVLVQEEEGSSSPNHNFESVAWVAIQATRGDVGGVFYEALLHDEGVNHIVATTVPLTNTFDDAPAIIANQQTTIGINTATVRQTFVSAGRVDLFVEEERSFDNEVGHVREDVAVLALSTGIIDGYIIDLFGDESGFSGRSLVTPGASQRSSNVQNPGINSDFLNTQSVQTMMLSREQFDSLGDAAFAQLGDNPEDSSSVPTGFVLNDEASTGEFIDRDSTGTAETDMPANPFNDLEQVL